MIFADIHIHALSGVDDGPKAERDMRRMVDAVYRDGTRVLCLTPHYHPGYFGENREKAEVSFGKLGDYVREKYPDLELFLGNELRYSPEAVSWLAEGACRAMNGTDFVLVDFHQDEKQKNIVRALEKLMNGGYTPILAHAERYPNLSVRAVQDLARNGVWIQLDVQSLFGDSGFGARLRSKALLKAGLIDVVSSDAHDLNSRIPGLAKGYRYVARKYTKAYADGIFYENALRILQGGNQEDYGE